MIEDQQTKNLKTKHSLNPFSNDSILDESSQFTYVQSGGFQFRLKELSNQNELTKIILLGLIRSYRLFDC